MAEFRMPKLGADMEAGTLVAWRKRPGDAVRRGEIVAEVETDKGVIDVEIFTNGVLESVLVEPGHKVPVGTPLAIVRETGATAESDVSVGFVGSVGSVAPQRAHEVAAASIAPPLPPPIATVDLTRIRISPAARRLARELEVDPNAITGTGHGGAITREDIEQAAHAKAGLGGARIQPVVTATTLPAASATPADKFARMRQSIAAAMSRSKREIPHYYLATTIDMHRALAWLADQNNQRPVTERLLYGVLLLKAVALALREVPELNATWEGDHVQPQSAIHVGVAISMRQGGLIAPAIHNTDQQSLTDLMRSFRDLVNRTRAGGLRSSELSDPTITVTSLGEQGVEVVFGVIYPPQVAILGLGKIVERPWAVAGQIVARPLITATLSADHRVTNGHRGALFLAAMDRLLQEPEKL